MCVRNQVLNHTQSYKHHIERLAQDLSGYEPEVSLAVRVKQESPPSDPDDEVEDNSEIDEYLSSKGFEYIDATQESKLKPTGNDEDDTFSEGESYSRALNRFLVN